MSSAPVAAYPGANGRILYTDTNNYSNYQMVTVKPDATGSTAIGANNLARRYATYSPDGTKITYTTDGSWQYIWIANADGSNAVQLTSGNTNGIFPSFSPDGTKILFANAVSGVYQLWTMNIDGTGAAVLSAQSYHMYKSSYSPDGTKIVFMATFGASDSEIGIMNSDGTGVTNLTNNSQHDDDPSFSPDGTKIVYNSLALAGGSEYQIHTMNIDGTGNTQLTSNSVYHGAPVYSPDGTKIAYRRGTSPAEVYYMNADGTGETRVTTNGWADSEIDWQPLTRTPTASTSSHTLTVQNGSASINVPSYYTDPYGTGIDAATVSVTTQPTKGSTSVNTSTGVITYTQTATAARSFWSNVSSLFFPKAAAASTDSFTYRVCSSTSSSLCSTGTVSVVLAATASNAALVAAGQSGLGLTTIVALVMLSVVWLLRRIPSSSE